MFMCLKNSHRLKRLENLQDLQDLRVKKYLTHRDIDSPKKVRSEM